MDQIRKKNVGILYKVLAWDTRKDSCDWVGQYFLSESVKVLSIVLEYLKELGVDLYNDFDSSFHLQSWLSGLWIDKTIQASHEMVIAFTHFLQCLLLQIGEEW